jgi:hypothetical protein
MKLQHIIFAVFVMGLPILTHAQGSCRPIETVDRQTHSWITAEDIEKSGQYCLTRDIKAPRVYVISEGGERSYTNSVMLNINASEVAVNLHGYAINVEASGMSGIRLGYKSTTPFHRKITIRNGTIKSRAQPAISFNMLQGSILSDFSVIYLIPGFAEDELQTTLKKLSQDKKDYQKTEYLIEHVKVQSAIIKNGLACVRCIAIGARGASNIIRNSTIEVEDGHAAIYLFGPNNLIENNIIIFKGKAAVESAAAIKLHQADGTIIRNNDIIIESSVGDEPKAAISLIDSKNVIAEGNRIYGIKTLMHAWDDTSNLIDRDNDFRSMLRRPWLGGKPGVQ